MVLHLKELPIFYFFIRSEKYLAYKRIEHVVKNNR